MANKAARTRAIARRRAETGVKSTAAQRDALGRADNAAAERARLEGERQAGRPDLAAIARVEAEHERATHELMTMIGQAPDRERKP